MTNSKIFFKGLMFCCICFIPHLGLSQTGAGGVGSTGTNPIWLNANALNLTNGTSVSNFVDQSGNGNDLSQSNSANQPIFTGSGLNGLPVVTFDGSNDYLTRGATSGLDGNNITVFVVFKRATSTSQTLINAGYTGELDKWMIYSNSGNERLVSKHKSPTNKFVYYIDAGSASFVSSHFESTGVKTYERGVLKQSSGQGYISESGHNLIRVGSYNYNLTGSFLNGFIAELVVFNTALNSLERIMVENYLGAKYNLAIPTDNYAYQGTHNIGLIGLGNDGTNTQTTAQGAGVLELSNATSLGSGDYFLAAHTNDDLTLFTTSDIPASISTHKRWTRTWRVGETNEAGTVDLKFFLSGGNNFAASSSYSLLVDASQTGNFSSSTPISGTYNSGEQSITFNVDLNDGDYFTVAGLEQILEIHSVTSGPWSDINTWDCLCIPTASDLVYIDALTDVTVDINAETDFLSIEPLGTLTMNAPVTLSISGNWDILGSLAFSDGTVALIGSADQVVDAAGNSVSFVNLEINNSGPSNVTFLEAEYILNGTLIPTSGNMIVTTPGINNFIINSTSATSGGRVGEIQSSFTSSGEFTVRRFLPSGVAGLRNLASPVNGAQFTDWDPNLEISCPDCPDGCAYDSNGCYNSIKKYKINQYIDVTSINDPIDNGTGYEAWVGDDLNVFSGSTLSSKGTLNDGNTIISTVSSQWEIKGNPYASPILFSEFGFSGVGQYFYVYDVTIGGYQWYDKVSNTQSTNELANGLLATGQAFWMTGPGTITLPQSVKTSSDATFIRSSIMDNSIYLALKENSSTYVCISSLQEADNSVDEYDLNDIKHLEFPNQKGPSMAFITSDFLLRKSYIEKDYREKSLPMYINILNDGYYTIEGGNIGNFNNYHSVLLHDNYTGDIINLKQEESYVFYSEIDSTEDRFTLILTNQLEANDQTAITANLSTNSDNLTITQMGNIIDINSSEFLGENVEITLTNILGQKTVYYDVTSIVQGSNLITIPSSVKGVNILTINNDGQLISKKLVF